MRRGCHGLELEAPSGFVEEEKLCVERRTLHVCRARGVLQVQSSRRATSAEEVVLQALPWETQRGGAAHLG